MLWCELPFEIEPIKIAYVVDHFSGVKKIALRKGVLAKGGWKIGCVCVCVCSVVSNSLRPHGL